MRVPVKRVSTYGEIARFLGTGAYRAVGAALSKNPYAPEVPCHRIVKSDGSLGGFSAGGGAARKKILLEKEGVAVDKDNMIVDFEKVFYPLAGADGKG